MANGKGLVRSLNRSGSKSGKVAPAERRIGRLAEPTACERCGAVFLHRAWQRSGRVSHAVLERAAWTVCPACRQVQAQEGCGRVIVQGTFVRAHEAEIRARLANIAAQAASTQPERRIVSIEGVRGALDIVTTSQKLAHRLVHELKKAFKGRATYSWSDDGTLFATWQRDEVAR